MLQIHTKHLLINPTRFWCGHDWSSRCSSEKVLMVFDTWEYEHGGDCVPCSIDSPHYRYKLSSFTRCDWANLLFPHLCHNLHLAPVQLLRLSHPYYKSCSEGTCIWKETGHRLYILEDTVISNKTTKNISDIKHQIPVYHWCQLIKEQHDIVLIEGRGPC